MIEIYRKRNHSSLKKNEQDSRPFEIFEEPLSPNPKIRKIDETLPFITYGISDVSMELSSEVQIGGGDGDGMDWEEDTIDE